jgi:hypothetical protein
MTYYAYLRDRVAAAALSSRPQLEQMIDAERNAFWQMLVTNPAYDERARMGALATFDEAAARIISEHERQGADIPAVLRPGPPTHANAGHDPYAGTAPRAAVEPYGGGDERRGRPARTWLRDALFLLIGLILGLALAYFGGGLIDAALKSAGMASGQRTPRLVASVATYKFGHSSPQAQEGELTVEYGSNTPTPPTQCDVEVTYRQLLEYVKFDPACKTVSFKFLPLDNLIQNFNYLQGYMVFTTTITSASGAWKGTASVYFSIDASA